MASAQPGTSSSAQAVDNREFLIRLQILIIDGGLPVLRNYVDQELSSQSVSLSSCLANERSTIKALKGRGIITQVQYDLLYPSSGIVSTSDLDITLIICLMRNLKCFKLNKKFNWNISPAQSDTSIEADICRLKQYRNEVRFLMFYFNDKCTKVADKNEHNMFYYLFRKKSHSIVKPRKYSKCSYISYSLKTNCFIIQ
jgi:hypothetical protein